MKRLMALMIVFALTLAGGTAGADTFKTLTQNEFTTAESLDAGLTQAGVHFTLGESYRSFYPTVRFGLGALFEAGVKFGATTADTGAEDKVVQIPTGAPSALRRLKLELLFEASYLKQDVYEREEEITLHLPEGPAGWTNFNADFHTRQRLDSLYQYQIWLPVFVSQWQPASCGRYGYLCPDQSSFCGGNKFGFEISGSDCC